MFELYTWMTDNGYKARQMAEESGLEYELKPVNIREKDQFKPEYLKIAQATRSQRSSTTMGPTATGSHCANPVLFCATWR